MNRNYLLHIVTMTTFVLPNATTLQAREDHRAQPAADIATVADTHDTESLPGPVRSAAGAGVSVVVTDGGDAGSQQLDLAVCRVHVQFSDPTDRLLSIGFGNVTTDDPQGFFQVAPPLGGDTAPREEDLPMDAALAYDSFVTIGLDVVATGKTDGTTTDPDFDSSSFATSGQAVGGWYNVPPTNSQGQPDSDLRVLAAQFTVRNGFNVTGDITAYFNDASQPQAASFDCAEAFTGCSQFADCADLDMDGVRDDNCVWWACEGATCVGTDIPFADMGGQFNACPPDGTADGNDRFHALNCFANTTSGGGPYLCEAGPPAAFNVDAGGQFGDCNPDGVCDGNDAFHALNAFANESSCSCPLDGGPMPQMPAAPPTIGSTHIALEAHSARVQPGDRIEVDAVLSTPLPDLRGYQLHLRASGGQRGHLKLVDIAIEPRKNHAFFGLFPWPAFNLQTGQMVAGLDSPGVKTAAGAYLATFTYVASKDAAGTFSVDVLHDDHNRDQRTFLFPTPAHGKIDIVSSTAARIDVVSLEAGRL